MELNETNNLTSEFRENRQGQSGPASPDKKEKLSAVKVFYDVAPEREDYVRRFKIRLKNGDLYSIAYATLPLIYLSHNEVLTIRNSNLLVTIKGRNLSDLEKQMSLERLIYIKASTGTHDTGEYDCYIASIEVEENIM